MPVDVVVEKAKLKNPPLDVRRLGDRALRQPAKRVAKVDDEVRLLVRKMLQTMYSEDGIGLAAPQVAVNKQIIIIDVNLEEPTTPPLVMINPTIQGFGEEVVLFEEGCLSIPQVFLEVRRPEVVKVSYRDEMGRPHSILADGIVGRVIQHEIDHLNGVLFVDRAENKIALSQELTSQNFSLSAVRALS
ncbi:peptide deformylase [Prochlorothrix hollandica]|uniref:Peptide deformylase n=1 Tax=Prochlorothrix hollandica PCC 9006 = CALU 1027 TaxID=317619 RepID=A0A0M2Q109_PROHO|nr:peptide deformylase [Prochlorothrix hollandica]KKJ00307.1 peptide deformylase [Prochlorothrix hollandica PCC 9006 = CALU 1027]